MIICLRCWLTRKDAKEWWEGCWLYWDKMSDHHLFDDPDKYKDTKDFIIKVNKYGKEKSWKEKS